MDSKIIHRIPKLYPKESCDKLINYFENNIDKAARGTYGDKQLNNLEIPITITNREDFFNLGECLENGINHFKMQYPYIDTHITPWTTVLSAQLCRYEPKNYYSTIHCENDGAKKYLRRVFAWMFFLNDIEEGGGTEFIFQDYIAKPKAGDFYIWPAYWSHLHRGVSAPRERKYILTGWCEYLCNDL
tara:strand:+ start:67 stop:627 length:561 start_codon:yes stop_codon:yes gene_type:complete